MNPPPPLLRLKFNQRLIQRGNDFKIHPPPHTHVCVKSKTSAIVVHAVKAHGGWRASGAAFREMAEKFSNLLISPHIKFTRKLFRFPSNTGDGRDATTASVFRVPCAYAILHYFCHSVSDAGMQSLKMVEIFH